jgi:hypothetical protein
LEKEQELIEWQGQHSHTGVLAWKNRIICYGEESPEQILSNENNFRIHPFETQQKVMGAVLREVGIVQNVIINLRRGDEWPEGDRGVPTLLDGHMRVGMAISVGQPTIPITYVDLSPDEESEILATLDTITGMAAIDKDQLQSIFDAVKTQEPDITEMMKELSNKPKEDVDPDALVPVIMKFPPEDAKLIQTHIRGDGMALWSSRIIDVFRT